MRWTGVVATLMVFALVIPAMTFAQAAPIGAWCDGSYGAEGTSDRSSEVQSGGE